ncbi:MAG: iron-sulfur cluster assembly accessory protein [Planctomycetes bacterium]|nr:iron-sulfur cluster assembly accessory protein [Planctomycetota bacterium]
MTINNLAAASATAVAVTAAPAAKPGRGVQITERAAKEIERVISEHKLPATSWVRIGAKGGGCSGFTYVLDFDPIGPTEFDLSFEQHGVKVVIDKKSEFFMGGTMLDFNDGLLDRGFVFKNPLATGTCGCGTSFSA